MSVDTNDVKLGVPDEFSDDPTAMASMYSSTASSFAKTTVMIVMILFTKTTYR